MLACERFPETRDRALGGSAPDCGNLLGFEPVLFPEPERAVHVGLGDGAAGIRLQGELGQLPGSAEVREERLELRFLVTAGESLVEAVGALEDRLRSGESGAGEERRGHTRVSCPARMQALGPRPVGQIFDDAARLAAADPEGVDEPVLLEAVELARDGRRGEAAGQRRRMIVTRVELARYREPDAAHDFDAGDHRFQDRATGRVQSLADGERGGDGDTASVDDGVLTRVVEVETVRERGVGEHGAGSASLCLGADQRALLRAAQPLGRLDHGQTELLLRRGEAAAESVEGERRRLRYDGCGHAAECQASHEARVASCDRKLGHVGSPV